MQAPHKIVLVTDNRVYEGVLRQYLKEVPCLLTVLSSGPELYAEAEAAQPDLMILQAQLHGSTGFEICRKLQQASPGRRLPMLIFSAEEESSLTALLAGADAFLKVPFTREALLAGMEKALAHRRTILLVDDSPVIHTAVTEMLDPEHYELWHANDGEEALQSLSVREPDLIISDLEMPKMNGFEFCHAVKSNPAFSAIPVLIQSSLSAGVDIDRSFAAGADDYITKPLVPEELMGRINLLLHQDRIYRPETILVADDSRLVRNLVGRGLGQQGFSVIFAANGEEALQKIRAHEIALLITDCEMPKMNGLELARAARAERDMESLPIIMLSARASRSDRVKGSIAGVDEYLSKPFVVDKMLTTIERLLASRRMQREKDALRLYLSDMAVEHASSLAGRGMGPWAPMRAKEQQLTILFSDLAGFTSLSEKLSPTEVIELLNDYFDRMVHVLKARDAVIDKFMGDAILALFPGTPEGAEAAVRAAAEMQVALAEFNLHSKHQLRMRVGINTGRVMMGDLGSKFHRREFTVIGDAVNIAQRVESGAPVGGVLITESTHRLARAILEVEPQPAMAFKGKADAVHTHILKSVNGVAGFPC